MRKTNKFGRIGRLYSALLSFFIIFWQVRIFHPKVFGRRIERRRKRKKTESSISKLCWCQGKLLDFHPMHNLACIKISKCRVANWQFPYKSSNEEERKAPSFSSSSSSLWSFSHPTFWCETHPPFPRNQPKQHSEAAYLRTREIWGKKKLWHKRLPPDSVILHAYFEIQGFFSSCYLQFRVQQCLIKMTSQLFQMKDPLHLEWIRLVWCKAMSFPLFYSRSKSN